MPPRDLAGDDLVELVHLEPVEDALLDRLDQVARAFAAGWNARRRDKQRRGEGLSWDTPGFEAP